MTPEQLDDILAEHVIEAYREQNSRYTPDHDSAIQELMWELDGFFTEPATVKAGVVTIQIVDFQGGGEDVFAGGEGAIWAILKVTTDGHEQFFRKDGTYLSFDGHNWDKQWREVRPTEKKVLVYE